MEFANDHTIVHKPPQGNEYAGVSCEDSQPGFDPQPPSGVSRQRMQADDANVRFDGADERIAAVQELYKLVV